MTDAQHLIDYARQQFNEIAADVERHFDVVAGNLRERFSRPLSAPAPRRLPPPTTWQIAQRWVSRHRALTAAIVAFLVTGSVGTVVAYVKSRDSQRRRGRRRAKKSASGARTEAVVVAGAVSNPLTSAIYLDLERRGFVVYVVAHTPEDEQYVRAHARVDLVPLPLDTLDTFTAQAQLQRLQRHLDVDHYAFPGAEPHRLRLAGMVLAPDATAGTDAKLVEQISAEEWSDALNAQVLRTIATTQLLLPAVAASRTRVLLLMPSLAAAVTPPRHALESTVAGALRGFVSTLAAELAPAGLPVAHFKLGDIDIPAVTARQRRAGAPAPRLRPTPLRSLHDAVFDALVAPRSPPRTVYVGRGSRTYDWIGGLAPPSWIAWMMGAGGAPAAIGAKKWSSQDGDGDDHAHDVAGSLTWEKVDQEIQSCPSLRLD